MLLVWERLWNLASALQKYWGNLIVEKLIQKGTGGQEQPSWGQISSYRIYCFEDKRGRSIWNINLSDLRKSALQSERAMHQPTVPTTANLEEGGWDQMKQWSFSERHVASYQMQNVKFAFPHSDFDFQTFAVAQHDNPFYPGSQAALVKAISTSYLRSMMFNNLQSTFIKYFNIRSNVLLARVYFNTVSIDCLSMSSCSSFLPAEDSLMSNLQRQNESKPSPSHKANHFFLHKYCKNFMLWTQLVTDFHISETEWTAKCYSRKQALRDHILH